MSIIPKCISSNQEYAAMLGQSDPFRTMPDGFEMGVLSLEVDQLVVWNSGEFSISKLAHQNHSIRFYWQRRKKLRLYLKFTKWRGGYPYDVRIKLPSPPRNTFPNGKTEVRTTPKSPAYPAAARRARNRVERNVKLRPPRSKSPKRSGPGRPNPEIIMVAYNIVSETNRVPGGDTPDTVEHTVVTPSSRLYYRRDWSGTRTPNFSRLKSKQLPVNPHSVKIKTVHANVLVNYNLDPNRGIYDATTAAWTDEEGVPSDPVHLEQARNRAIRNLIGKAELGIDANLAQDLAQFRQIPQMIATNATKIAKSFSQLKRGNLAGAADTLDRKSVV